VGMDGDHAPAGAVGTDLTQRADAAGSTEPGPPIGLTLPNQATFTRNAPNLTCLDPTGLERTRAGRYLLSGIQG
jgi:hypothetical protein